MGYIVVQWATGCAKCSTRAHKKEMLTDRGKKNKLKIIIFKKGITETNVRELGVCYGMYQVFIQAL